MLASLRRDTVAKPVIFVGAGTCGLGAGAGKTLTAVREFLAQNKIDADVVEVGCNGMCSDEPIMDIQVPGRARVSFSTVTADKAPKVLEAVLLQNRIPTELVLGQYRTASAQALGRDCLPRRASVPFAPGPRGARLQRHHRSRQHR